MLVDCSLIAVWSRACLLRVPDARNLGTAFVSGLGAHHAATDEHVVEHTIGDAQRILASVLNFALSHGVVALGSVIHHVPTAAPHSWLLRYMRVILLVYTINSWANVFILLSKIDQIDQSDAAR